MLCRMHRVVNLSEMAELAKVSRRTFHRWTSADPSFPRTPVLLKDFLAWLGKTSKTPQKRADVSN